MAPIRIADIPFRFRLQPGVLVRFRIFILACMVGVTAGCRLVDGDSSRRADAPPHPSLTAGHPGRPPSNHPPDPDKLAARPVAYQQLAESLRQPLEDVPPPPKPAPAVAALTLEQLQQDALAGNPSLAAMRARVAALHGKRVQVGLPPNTELGYAGQQLLSDGESEQQGLFIGQEFVRGKKLQLSRAVVAREIQQAHQQLAAQRQRVMTDVRLGYYDVLVAQRRNRLTQELVDVARRGVAAAEALLKAKEVSQVDVMRAGIELQQARLVDMNARNRHAAAWSRLAAVIARPDLQPQPLAGDLETGLDAIRPEVALARIRQESPEMAHAVVAVERARWALRRACAEPTSNVSMQAIVQHDNATDARNMNLQVTVPIPWLDYNQGGIRQARANVVAAQRTVDQLALDLQQRLAPVYRRYADARNQVTEYSKPDGIVAHSRRALELVRQGYQAGELNVVDLLSVQRTYSQNNLLYLEALGQLWAAAIEIEGLLLKNSLTVR